MNRIVPILILLCTLWSGSLFAQRYSCEVFDSVVVTTNVPYATNYSFLSGGAALDTLELDFYAPFGDTEDARPLVIFLHAGSFLPKGLALPFGDKNDPAVKEMCTQFARRGFVAAAINYRVGWNPFAATQELKAKSIIQAVYRAMIDGKSAVRFFKADAAGADVYGIDTTNIIVGGSNSGAYVALAMATMDKTAEINLPKFQDGSGNSFIDQTIMGDFEGAGGDPGQNVYNHPGHTSDFSLVLNMGGAIGDTSWLEAGDVPIISFHGISDPLTPYGTAIVIVSATGDPVVEVSGSRDIASRANNLGNHSALVAANFSDPVTTVAESRSSFEGLLPFPGGATENGFEPWAWYPLGTPQTNTTSPLATGYGSNANPGACPDKAARYTDSIMQYFIPRSILVLGLDTTGGTCIPRTVPTAPCVLINGVTEVVNPNVANLYPNPATNQLHLELKGQEYQIKQVNIYDITGRLVLSDSNVSDPQYHSMSLAGINGGSYIVSISFQSGEQVNKRLIVQ